MSRPTRSAAVTGAACLAALALAAPALATQDVSTRRLAGADRYDTSAAIAQAGFPQGTTVAVLASGERFPDALAGSYLAGRLDAPLLLTAAASLSVATEAQLDRSGASGVTIVGGEQAVSAAVENRLESLGYEVERIAGGDRYATARAIAETFPADFVGSFGAGRTAVVASGLDFPDALAGSPLSFAEAFPTLLTPVGSLSPSASAALTSLGIEQVLVLGGDRAVSAEVEDELESDGITVRRISGANRQQTAAAIASFAFDEIGFDVDRVLLARGDEFADALSGGPLGGVQRSPLVLTSTTTSLGVTTQTLLRQRNATIAAIDVLGGRQAVSDAVVAEADAAATTP